MDRARPRDGGVMLALLALPNAFAAAYFAACMVVGGAVFCSLALVVAYLLRGGR